MIINTDIDTAIPASHKYIKPNQLADAIGKSRPWVYMKIKTGDIAAYKVAGSLRITLKDAMEYIEQNTTPVSEEK